MKEYIVEILVAMIAGFFGAVVGGGGLITLPFILSLGDAPVTAIGTNKMLSCLTTSSSASICVKKNLINLSKWKYCIFFTILGCFFGVFAITKIPAYYIKKTLPYLIIGVCLYIVFKKNDEAYANKIDGDSHKFSTSMFGFFLGFYNGFIGSGVGVFATSFMIAKYKVSLVDGIVISRVMCFIGNTISFLFFAILGHVNYKVGLVMGLAMAVGSFVGIHMAFKWGHKFIKSMLGVICILMCLQLILQW